MKQRGMCNSCSLQASRQLPQAVGVSRRQVCAGAGQPALHYYPCIQLERLWPSTATVAVRLLTHGHYCRLASVKERTFSSHLLQAITAISPSLPVRAPESRRLPATAPQLRSARQRAAQAAPLRQESKPWSCPRSPTLDSVRWPHHQIGYGFIIEHKFVVKTTKHSQAFRTCDSHGLQSQMGAFHLLQRLNIGRLGMILQFA